MTEKTIKEIIEWCDKNIKYRYYHYYGKYRDPQVELMKKRAINCSDRGKRMTKKKPFKINNEYEYIAELEAENEQLKQQKDKWKQQCIHFKEMLDDMDIAYLCDEWIYEELKGDVE